MEAERHLVTATLIRLAVGEAAEGAGILLVGVTLIQSSQSPVSIIEPVFVVWCVAIPVIDTLQVMYQRIKDGRSIFDSDRLHMHYRLVDAGYGKPRVMAMMLAGNALVVGLGLILTLISPILSLIVFIALGPIYANWTALRIRAAWLASQKQSRRRFDSL